MGTGALDALGTGLGGPRYAQLYNRHDRLSVGRSYPPAARHRPVRAAWLLAQILEIAALALIPMTLARILSVAGLGVLLVLARWALKEPLGPRETFGVGLVALGIVAASFAPPRLSAAPPTLEEWVMLLAIL